MLLVSALWLLDNLFLGDWLGVFCWLLSGIDGNGLHVLLVQFSVLLVRLDELRLVVITLLMSVKRVGNDASGQESGEDEC